MPADELELPFDSIESAIDFMNVLAETILEARKDLRREQEMALRSGQDRRAQAVDLALFKLKILSCHIFKSRRALNDLRMIRRLLLNDRLTVENVLATM